ncbi:MAG: hypothetical protein K2O01_04105, partial [Bacteroidales bacterium]|nr:hypothetical protein [Bacteroidales bacterium]
MRRNFAAFVFTILCLASLSYGQRPSAANRVFKSDYGRAVLVGSLRGGFFQYLSGDARYISGTLGGGAGFIYDVDKDSSLFFMNYTVPACVSPAQYAAQGDPGDICGAFIHYNGRNIPLERFCYSGKASWDDISVWGYQPNGDKVVGMGYETVFNAEKTDSLHTNIAAVFNGKTGKLERKLRPYWPMHPTFRHSGNIGYGSRGDCISGDGTVVGGHGTNPNEKLNWQLTFWDISSPDTTYTFALEGREYSFGTFFAANHDGSVLVGQSENLGTGVIVHYNKNNKTFSHEDIYPLPGWDFLAFTGIADDDLIIGYCGLSVDPGTRLPIVYTRLTGVLPLTEFIYEYYDINVGKLDLYTPMAIRKYGDKHVLGGFLYDYMGGSQVWFVEFCRERILPRARKISARAGRSTPQVQITWQTPLVSANHLLGYNIY